jgi:hypothetical protein
MWIGRNAFVQGICANIGEGETYFLKTSRARGTHAHVHYICAQDRLIHLRISLSQSQDSCSQFRISCSRQKVVRLFQKWYDFSESPTTFSHISYSRRRISCSHRRINCSRQKAVPLFRVTAAPGAKMTKDWCISAITSKSQYIAIFTKIELNLLINNIKIAFY